MPLAPAHDWVEVIVGFDDFAGAAAYGNALGEQDALVKKLIAAENPAKPLSDSKLTSMLSEQGIMVARRTVAKYRESLSIPPSNQRKQLV